MNAYEKSVQLGLTGTDEEKVAALRATGLTASKIPLADLLFLLRNRNMLVRLIRPADTGEKWSGTVVNMVLAINDSGPTEYASAVNRWFSHITDDRAVNFDTTDVSVSASFWLLAQMMGSQENMPSSDDFSAVAALGGGWLFADLTVEQFAAQKTAAQVVIAQQELEAEWVAIQNDGGINTALAAGDRDALKAALAAAIEVL